MSETDTQIDLRINTVEERDPSIPPGFFVLGGLLLFLVALGALWGLQTTMDNRAQEEALRQALKEAAQRAAVASALAHDEPTSRSDPYGDLNLWARAAVVYDIHSGTFLYERNPHTVLPLASLTKLMTAYTASRVLADGDPVTIDADALAAEGSSGLRLGDRWQYADLSEHMLVTSSNDASLAIAKKVDDLIGATGGEGSFMALMNQTANTAGLQSFRFDNPSGLDVSSTRSGGYGSAHDVALFIARAYSEDHDFAEATRHVSVQHVSANGISYTATNTNELVDNYPGIRLSKTGYTDLAGGNLAVVLDTSFDRPVVIVVLGSSIDGRFTDVENLTWATYDRLAYKLDES